MNRSERNHCTGSLFMAPAVFALLLTAAACVTTTDRNLRAADGSFGPGVTVPQNYMVDNGDRAGPYPPYYYPDGSTGGGCGGRRR